MFNPDAFSAEGTSFSTRELLVSRPNRLGRIMIVVATLLTFVAASNTPSVYSGSQETGYGSGTRIPTTGLGGNHSGEKKHYSGSQEGGSFSGRITVTGPSGDHEGQKRQ